MTDTPSSAAKDSPGEHPEEGGDERFAPRRGQHESPGPLTHGPGTEQSRHEMAGSARCPQFGGPGAAQYGSEPVVPPPPLAQHPQPSYGPPGTVPAPGPQQTYGYQAVGPTGLDVGNALSYGWERFRVNPGPWVGISAVGVVIYLTFMLVVQVADPTSLFTVLLIFLAVMAALWLLQAAMVRGALYETDGSTTTFGSYFRFVNAGNVLLTALLAFVLSAIAAMFCFVPGIIVGFLCMFSLHYVVDQDEGPFTALKSSATLVMGNIWPVLVLALAVVVVTVIGLLLCGLGLLVAGPVATIAVTYAYRTLTEGTVAPI